MCVVCFLGKGLDKVNITRLNEHGRIQLQKNKKLYQNHLKIVENQKTMHKRIKSNLSDTGYVVILHFKENFRLNYDIVELGIYHYNKR